jgi:hypothetical protein
VLQAFTSALSREVRYSGAALVLLTSAHLSGSGVGGEGGLMDTVLSLISLPSMAEVGNLVPVLGSTMIALGCAPAAGPPDHPVPSREAIFGRRAVEASGWDGGRPGGHRHHSPYPSVSSFSLHLLLGGAVCAVPGTARAYSHGAMRACCVRRSGCGQGGLRWMLTAMLTAKDREKCCPDCGAGYTRSV